MAVLLRPPHLGCRNLALVIFGHPFFRLGVRVDHYFRGFGVTAAGEQKSADYDCNWKDSIHTKLDILFANQPDFQLVTGYSC